MSSKPLEPETSRPFPLGSAGASWKRFLVLGQRTARNQQSLLVVSLKWLNPGYDKLGSFGKHVVVHRFGTGLDGEPIPSAQTEPFDFPGYQARNGTFISLIGGEKGFQCRGSWEILEETNRKCKCERQQLESHPIKILQKPACGETCLSSYLLRLSVV